MKTTVLTIALAALTLTGYCQRKVITYDTVKTVTRHTTYLPDTIPVNFVEIQMDKLPLLALKKGFIFGQLAMKHILKTY